MVIGKQQMKEEREISVIHTNSLFDKTHNLNVLD